jgi:heme-degrading monooxygenase HmoA
VYTRWRDEASFTAWAESRAFQQGHAQREPGAAPVATGSELWSFLVEQRELAPAG